MKNKYISMIILAILLGVLIGIQFKSSYQEKFQLSFVDRQFVGDINAIKKENAELKRKLDTLNENLKFIEKNTIVNDIEKGLKEQVDSLKLILGYLDVKGPGMTIKIDTKEEVNLGFVMEEKKILISLINEIRIYGGEVISINNQRITPYSEVTLAGNHININSTPIAQPYEIKIIGDIEKLNRYINKGNVLIDTMINMYDLNVDITSSKELIIYKAEREKKTRYVRNIEDM
ncbi:DUF881 domain-containing protein [Alkalithermobacter paradoxus]|uniref:Division initiation protein n=1 Tax=Alkalithermobacter paradoxus TaxID=29349 RepID=A0A1V4I8K0_9FIRM|nr:hypothetical protein CLOTH_07320 [[Clostridium] thermoalcaliphilum]